MKLSDYDYTLPADRIAQAPAERRDAARLLVHDVDDDRTVHTTVAHIGEHLRAGDLLVLNDTRVLPARVAARRASGGAVQLLFLEPDPGGPAGAWSAMVQPARRLKVGESLRIEGGGDLEARLVRRLEDGRTWSVLLAPAGDQAPGPGDVERLLEEVGRMPLPPYIERSGDGADAQDRERYQTVYAARPGAVAAPTAGLHFTQELLEDLRAAGVRTATVTLHVGAGTFLPMQSDDIEDHPMHAERFELPASTVDAVAAAQAGGGRVVCVGTTSVRVLESRADSDGALEAGAGSTRLFLRPGSPFHVVDGLLTNFHLPKSTLLCLVSAFAGRERVLGLYAEAIERGYRFYSYGDASLFTRRPRR